MLKSNRRATASMSLPWLTGKNSLACDFESAKGVRMAAAFRVRGFGKGPGTARRLVNSVEMAPARHKT